MFSNNIIQQEQNRKNQATANEHTHKTAKLEGLLGILGHKKKESIQERNHRLRQKGVF